MIYNNEAHSASILEQDTAEAEAGISSFNDKKWTPPGQNCPKSQLDEDRSSSRFKMCECTIKVPSWLYHTDHERHELFSKCRNYYSQRYRFDLNLYVFCLRIHQRSHTRNLA